MRRELLRVTGNESLGPYTLLRVERGDSTRDGRGSSSCSRHRDGSYPGR